MRLKQILIAIDQLANSTGLRASVESAVQSGSQDLKDAWEYAQEFKRHDPLVLGLGAADCRIAISVEVCAEVVQKGRDTDAMFVLTAAEQLEVWTDV